MKKFYTFALAVGVAASAFAAPRGEKVNVTSNIPSGIKTESVGVQAQTRASFDTDYDAIDDWKDAGTGLILENALSSAFSDISHAEVVSKVEQSESKPGIYRFRNPYNDISYMDKDGNEVEIWLIIDATDPNYVVIPLQYSGVGARFSDGTVAQAYVQSYSDYFVDDFTTPEDVIEEGMLDPQMKIYFDQQSKYLFFGSNCMLIRFLDDKGNPVRTSRSSLDGYAVLPGGEKINAWQTVGQGSIRETMLSTFFFEIDETDQELIDELTYDVEVCINKFTGMFMIPDIFTDFSVLASGQAYDKECDMQFDLTHPEYVCIPRIDAGVVDSDGYTIDILSTYGNGMALSGESVDEAFMEAHPEMCITYDEETHVVNIPLSDNGENGEALLYYLYDGNGQGLGFYVNNCAVPCVITFPDMSGVNTVAVDNSNAPVEFFNIQGMRVANPQPGQLVIKRQGTKATKVIVR